MASKKDLPSDEKIRLGALGNKIVMGGLALGVGSLAVALVAGFLQDDALRRFFHAYLIGVSLCTTFALGALFFVIIQHLVRAQWSVTVRRIAEILTQTFPLLFVLVAAGIMLPMLLGSHSLHIWTDPEIVHGLEGVRPADHLLEGKPWLNVIFFCGRMVLYFMVWIGLSRYFFKKSVEQDQSGDPEISNKLRWAAGPAIVAFGVTCGFSAFDFTMVLTPHWYSTMWPIYWFAGCAISIMALLILIPLGLQAAGKLKTAINTEHYHDLGKLLFAFIFFWGYVAFSQFMLQWYADLPEETVWMKVRLFDAGNHDWVNWKWLSFALLMGHFILPFLCLLSRETKRRLQFLALFAAWMLLMHFMDFYYIVMPAMDQNAELVAGLTGYTWGWGKLLLIDLPATAGVVGLFVAAAAKVGQRVNLVPTKDPSLGESLAFENY